MTVFNSGGGWLHDYYSGVSGPYIGTSGTYTVTVGSKAWKFTRALIRVAANIAYEDAQAAIDNKPLPFRSVGSSSLGSDRPIQFMRRPRSTHA